MQALDGLGVPYLVVPGVTSAAAAAAALKVELTLPEIAQTVIITRQEGRTPVPERERIHDLARHQTTMMIFLSVGMLDKVVEELFEGGYAIDALGVGSFGPLDLDPASPTYGNITSTPKLKWRDYPLLKGLLHT